MKIKIKETKETEIMTGEDFEESSCACCPENLYDNEEYCPTPLETGFRQWKERRKQCENKIVSENLTEELLYSCLPDDYKSCRQVLRA